MQHSPDEAIFGFIDIGDIEFESRWFSLCINEHWLDRAVKPQRATMFDSQLVSSRYFHEIG